MQKKQSKKMVLSKETLRHLAAPEIPAAGLDKAAGGAFPNSDANTYNCHTASCHPGLC